MRALALLAVLCLAVTVGPVTAAEADDSEKTWEARLDLNIVDRILLLALENPVEVEPPKEWMPLERFAKSLPKAYQKRLPVKDPWGGDYSLRLLENKVLVVSYGPNGLLDAFPATDGESPPPRPRNDTDVEGDDIVLIVGDEILNAPRTNQERMKATMEDLRSIGVAVEEYSIDYNLYPGQLRGLASVDGIRSVISPLYIRNLPIKDSWGNEFLYWSDERSYIIVSTGADGVLDQPYGTQAGSIDNVKFVGGFSDPATDLVFANGQFVQWPTIEPE